jgi:PhnB protein
MAKAAKKKKTKPSKKSARVAAKPKAAARSAKPAKKPAPKKKKAAAPRKVDPLNRKAYRSVTPMLAVSNIREAIHFYKNAFGFAVQGVMETPGGIMHAELVLRDMKVMLSPEEPHQNALSAKSIGNTPVTLYVLVDDVDAVFSSAVAAGGSTLMPVADMFWGDRCGVIGDPDGNKWMIATHKAEPTEQQMAEAMRQAGPPAESAGPRSAESDIADS